MKTKSSSSSNISELDNENINELNNNNKRESPIQFEYLNLLKKNHLLPLKNLCFLLLSKIIIENINNEITESNQNTYYNNSNNNSNQVLLEKLPLDLREELVHFMLEYRLFHNSKIQLHSIPFQSIIDNRIRSLDFSVVKSKVSISDPTKDILKLTTNIQNLDFTNCYNVNDTFIKIIINHLSSSSSSSSTSSSLINSNNISPFIISKSKSTDFCEKVSLSLDIEDSSSNSSINSSNSSNNSTNSNNNNNNNSSSIINNQNLINLKKQKRFSLKNKIFSKKKQQQDSLNDSGNNSLLLNQRQSLNEINEEILANGLYDLVLSPRLLTNDSGLVFLSLRQCSLISDQVIRKLIKLSPNLAYLDLSGCKISQKTLLVITTTCNKLKTLNIGNLESPLSSSLAQSISKLSNLASLDLSSIPKFTSQLLNLILYSPGEQFIHRASISAPPTPRDSRNQSGQNNILLSPRLSSSSINQQPLSPRDYHHHQQQQQQPLSPRDQQQPLVKKINLSPSIQSLSSISSASSNLFTPRSLLSFEVTGVFPNTLLSINISQTEVDDVGLLIMAKKCIYLQDLDISYCTKITNQGLSDMSNYIETLVTFSAKVVKASFGILDLVSVNLNLVKLELQFTKLEESHLKEMSLILTKLTTLRLDGTPMTDEIFNNFSKKNLNLQIIGLSQCKGITFEVFSILGNNCKLLKKFYLSHCKMSSSNSKIDQQENLNQLELFLNECSNLSVLDIAFTPLVKDQVLEVLIKSKCSKSLEVLFIGGGFHNLSNSVVRQLVYSCPKIRVFSCISCYNIKDDAILLAMDRWLVLEALELTDCTSLTSLTPNFIGENSHIHSHVRFIFLSISSNINDLDEDSILEKLTKESSLEIFEINQEITLENVIEQNWLIV